MSINSGSMTLAQYAIESNQPWIQQVTYSLLETAHVLNDIPLVVSPQMFYNGARFEGSLPSVNWSPINTSPTSTIGTPTPYQESLYLIRNYIDIDRLLIEDKNAIEDPRRVQIQAFLHSMSYDLNDKFINNDHVTGNQNAFVGLKARLSNPAQYGVRSDLNIQLLGSVNISPTGLTASNANGLIEAVQQALDYMGSPDGNGCVIYMNDFTKRAFEAAIRILGAGGGFSMVRDAFDRSVSAYKAALVRDMGRKADQVTRVISQTENSDGSDTGNGQYSSIYVVKYGPDALNGWMFRPLEQSFVDVGLANSADQTIYRTMVDFGMGLIASSNQCMSRISGIKVF